MWQSFLKVALSILIDKLMGLITKEWKEYQENEKNREEIKKKVKAIKDAKTKEEIRRAVRDLSI